MNSRALVLLAGLVAVAWAFRKWRTAVQAAMVLVILEGAIRKWLLPGAQDLVYFGKDVLLIGAFGGFLASGLARRARGLVPPAVTAILVASSALGALEILNPLLPTPLLGLLGFKTYFLYAPLLWVLPAVFPSDRDLARFLKRLLLLAIPVGLLATAQFFSSASSWLNTYARGGSEYALGFGSSTFVRVTGTFSFISGFSSYLLATAVLLLGVLAATGWRLTSQIWVHVCLGFTLTSMMMTGSRGPVFTLFLILPFYWLLSLAREKQAAAMFGRFLLALGLMSAALVWLAPQAIGAFSGRAFGGGDVGGRFYQPFIAPIHAFSAAGPLGFGIGATHQAAGAVVAGGDSMYWLMGSRIEVETGRVMLELGPIGFLIWYGLRFTLAAFAFRASFTLRSRFHRAMSVASALFLVSQLPGSVVFDPTASLYHWFIAALVPTMIALDRRVSTPREVANVAERRELVPDFSLPQKIRPIPSGSR